MDQASLAFVLLGLFGAPGVDDVRVDRLEERHRQSIASPAGREYEAEAVRAFRGDASVVRECAPSGARTPERLTLWLAIEEDGTVRDLAIAPETAVARCIRRQVADRVFPEPPAPFVARIDLPFRD